MLGRGGRLRFLRPPGLFGPRPWRTDHPPHLFTCNLAGERGFGIDLCICIVHTYSTYACCACHHRLVQFVIWIHTVPCYLIFRHLHHHQRNISFYDGDYLFWVKVVIQLSVGIPCLLAANRRHELSPKPQNHTHAPDNIIVTRPLVMNINVSLYLPVATNGKMI